MKILHVLDCSIPNISGYSLRSKFILEYQKELGIEVLSVTSPNHKASNNSTKEILNNITYHRTNLDDGLIASIIKKEVFIKSILVMRTLKNKIMEVVNKTGAIDIIHAHSPILCGLPALTIGKKYKIPVVYEVRALWEDAAVDLKRTKNNSLRYILTRHYETKLLRQVAADIVLCQGLKKEMVSRGIEESKIHVIPNGIDIDKFLPQPKDPILLQKYNLKGGVVFGFIGSFFEFEGLEYFLRAISKVISQHNSIKALIVGGGKREHELRNLASKLHGSNHIIFTNKVPHNMIQRFYSIIDILVYPRLKNRLTELVTPLKPLEAMSMEKAVLASDVGGLKELIQDGKTGILFKAGSIDDLVQKMIYLIQNNQKRWELGKNAREYVVENRNWKKISEKYLDIYSDLLNYERTYSAISSH